MLHVENHVFGAFSSMFSDQYKAGLVMAYFYPGKILTNVIQRRVILERSGTIPQHECQDISKSLYGEAVGGREQFPCGFSEAFCREN